MTRPAALARMLASAFVACIVIAVAARAPAQERPATPPAESPEIQVLPPVRVIAPSPLSGAGAEIDRDKVPATVHSLSPRDIGRQETQNLTDVLFQRVPGMSLSDPSGNSAAQEIRYRGFAASPLQGRPHGLAVYVNGIRINEAFGDTVNWDLIPTNAIQRADVWSSNPVFGLNALGGAISLSMKNGFTFQGFAADVEGGSFGRISGGFELGVQKQDVALYVAAQLLHDDGWRDHSPTDLARLYLDVGWRYDRGEVHLIGAAATNFYGAIAATPVELLDRDRGAVFTTPQTTNNEMALLALNATHALTDTWSVQANAYGRGFRQRHLDGNVGEFERCSNAGSARFRDQLCLDDDGFPRPNPVTTAFRDQFAVLDQNDATIPCPPGAGNTCASVPYGTVDRTETQALQAGLSVQATSTAKLFGHGNHFLVGGSFDHSTVDFTARSRLGFINPDLRVVTASPGIPGLGAIIHTFGAVGVGPVELSAENTYYGLYVVDTFDITQRLSATLGGRLNVAKIRLRDRLGTSPDLDSDTTYTRFNPVAGLTYTFVPGVSVFTSYAEANRVPTPLENACSDSLRPCLIESFLVADPPLKQVVSKTYEAGLRGNVRVPGGGTLDWKLALFRTDSHDDIVQVRSSIAGRGSFQNVPETRRQGVEAGVQYESSRWLAYVNYSFVDATYEFSDELPSPNNPFADDNGNVRVRPGKEIPGIPRHQGKLGLDYLVTRAWKVGADLSVVGSQWFVGDDANQNRKLPGYWLAGIHTSYELMRNVEIFARVNNLFDKHYSVFGTFFDPQGVANAGMGVALSDPRTEVPGQPRTIYGGIRVRF